MEEITQEFYIGQIFEGSYPPQAAFWCNEQGNCYIEETKEIEGYTKYQITEIPQPTVEEEQKRISMLYLSSADVERAIYKTKGLDFDDIIELVSHSELVSESIDIKALKIELKANNFYRGNPFVSQIGALLGLTETQLDEFFETNDYTKLIGQQDDLV